MGKLLKLSIVCFLLAGLLRPNVSWAGGQSEIADEATVESLPALMSKMDKLSWPENPAERIEKILQKDKSSIPKIIAKLKDPNAAVRSNAALALRSVGKDGQPFMTDLITAFKDRDDRVRRNILIVWGNMGPSAAKAVPDLASTLKDKNEYIRRNVARVLGEIGLPANSSLSELNVALDDPDCQVRHQAKWAIQNIAKPGTVPYMQHYENMEKECEIPDV